MRCNLDFSNLLSKSPSLCKSWPPIMNRRTPFLLHSCRCKTCQWVVSQRRWSISAWGFLSRIYVWFLGRTWTFPHSPVVSRQSFINQILYLLMYLYHPYLIMQLQGLRLTPLNELASNIKIPYFLSRTIIATWSDLAKKYRNQRWGWTFGPWQKSARLQTTECLRFGSWRWIRLTCSKGSFLG